MKKIIAVVLFLSLVGCGKSEAGELKSKQEREKQNKEAIEQDMHCRDFIYIANLIMTARQGGMTLEESLKASDKYLAETKDQYRYAIMKRMVAEAYRQPVFETGMYQRQQLENFKSEWYSACIESFEILKKRKQAK